MEEKNNLDKLSSFVDGELQGTERLEAAEDIYTSPATRDSWIAFERGKAAIEATPRAMPDTLRQRLSSLTETQLGEEAPWGWQLFRTPRAAWAVAAAAMLFAFASHWDPIPRQPKTIPLAQLLAEHAQATRKSPDIGRAIVLAAPYDLFRQAEQTP